MGQVLEICAVNKEKEKIVDEINKDQETQDLAKATIETIGQIENQIGKQIVGLEEEIEDHKKQAISHKKKGNQDAAISFLRKYKHAEHIKKNLYQSLTKLYTYKISIDTNLSQLKMSKFLEKSTSTLFSKQNGLNEKSLDNKLAKAQEAAKKINITTEIMKQIEEVTVIDVPSIENPTEDTAELLRELEALEGGMTELDQIEEVSTNKNDGNIPPPIAEHLDPIRQLEKMKSQFEDTIEQRSSAVSKKKEKQKKVAEYA